MSNGLLKTGTMGIALLCAVNFASTGVLLAIVKFQHVVFPFQYLNTGTKRFVFFCLYVKEAFR